MLKGPSEKFNSSDIALNFMTYLASNADHMGAFCNQSGMAATDIKDNLTSPAFQAFLLDYALQDESLLLAFAEEMNIRPQDVTRARRNLPGYDE